MFQLSRCQRCFQFLQLFYISSLSCRNSNNNSPNSLTMSGKNKMTLIAITGFPNGYSRKQLVLLLTPVIGGKFEVLKFDPILRNPKTCYVRVSPKVDILEVTKKINTLRIGPYKLLSFISSQNPDLPLGKNLKLVSAKLNRLNIPPGYTTETILQYTHEQILLEMQSIYTGLYALNNKTGDKLLEAIGQIVYDRLKVISNNIKIETCITLSKLYRKTHPHFADFQLILSTLHKIQDKIGKPRQNVDEKELLTVGIKPYAISNISKEQIEDTSVKYSEKIIKTVVDHVNNLSTTIDKNSREETARIEVRKQLKSMLPYFPNIIRDVIYKHLSPQQSTVFVVKIYGEPSLPSKGSMRMWCHCFNLYSVSRSERIYNLLLARCPASRQPQLLAADGTLLGGSKLIIRPADTPYKKVPLSIKHDLNTSTEEQKIEDVEMEWTGEW